MLCMYNYVDKNYDEIIPYTHNTTHVIILPLEIIHYTICLTYNTFNNLLLREGYALSTFHYNYIRVYIHKLFWAVSVSCVLRPITGAATLYRGASGEYVDINRNSSISSLPPRPPSGPRVITPSPSLPSPRSPPLLPPRPPPLPPPRPLASLPVTDV